MKETKQTIFRSVIKLSHDLGREDRRMAILGEGNTSAKINEHRFFIKASGSSLSDLRSKDIVECKADVLLTLFDGSYSDQEIEDRLFESRVNSKSKKPSVEALFHAYLLTLENALFVGHTHAIAVNQILCSPRGQEFAEKRIFPDEIVCCGAHSVYIPYTDPGLSLAKRIHNEVGSFMDRYHVVPRVILIQNHGIITIGKTPNAVLAAMLMAEKAAQIWNGAAIFGGPTFLSEDDVQRIANRSDEHYRQRALQL